MLNLPASSHDGQSVGFVNSLFTSTSAVCVTGLVVVDTGTHWTLLGQIIIIFLIQIGGLGFMTVATIFTLIVGRRVTLKERLLMQEALNQFDLEGLVRLTKNIIIATFIIELIGALSYSLVFVPQFGWGKGIYFGIFHSIAGFCNAGFDLIGGFNSFTPYVDNVIINVTTMTLIIIGGLGFSVWMDIYDHRTFNRYSLHTKVVLIVTVLLIFTGAMCIFIFEYNNPLTLKNLSPIGKTLASFFHSITPRTAGFNTLNNASLTTPTIFLTIILMFIGGSSGSTAGGIKTNTAGILLFTLISVVKGREDAEVFEKRIPKYLVYRALAVTMIALGLVIIVTMILSVTENADFLTLLFEATSAYGTVGLTLGFTPNSSIAGRAILIFTMFAGRVGPLTLALAFAQGAQKNKSNLKYPEDKIMVG